MATLTGGPLRSAFTLVGIALPGTAGLGAWRFSFFALGRGDRAFLNDFVWAAVLFPGAALLLSSGKASMPALMAAWAIAGWTAAAVGLLAGQSHAQAQPSSVVAPRAAQSGLPLLRRVRRIERRHPALAVPDRRPGNPGRCRRLESWPDHSRSSQRPLSRDRARCRGRGGEAPWRVTQKDGRAIWMVSALLTVGTVAWAMVALMLPDSLGKAPDG